MADNLQQVGEIPFLYLSFKGDNVTLEFGEPPDNYQHPPPRTNWRPSPPQAFTPPRPAASRPVTSPRQPVPPLRNETEAERQARRQREEAVVARAEADIDAGPGIENDDLEKMLDDLDRDENTPLPAFRNNSTDIR